MRTWPSSVRTSASWPRRMRARSGSGTYTLSQALARSVTTTRPVPRAASSPASASFSVTTPATGLVTTASFSCCSSWAMRASVAWRRAAAASFSSGRNPAFRRRRRSPRRVEAGRGHVAPRAGVVAGLRRARARGQEPLHAIEVLGRAREVGLRAHHLGLGLADVLDARAGASQAQLGLGLGALGPGGGEGELGVGRVDAGDLLADGDGGPLVDREPFRECPRPWWRRGPRWPRRGRRRR